MHVNISKTFSDRYTAAFDRYYQIDDPDATKAELALMLVHHPGAIILERTEGETFVDGIAIFPVQMDGQIAYWKLANNTSLSEGLFVAGLKECAKRGINLVAMFADSDQEKAAIKSGLCLSFDWQVSAGIQLNRFTWIRATEPANDRIEYHTRAKMQDDGYRPYFVYAVNGQGFIHADMMHAEAGPNDTWRIDATEEEVPMLVARYFGALPVQTPARWDLFVELKPAA